MHLPARRDERELTVATVINGFLTDHFLSDSISRLVTCRHVVSFGWGERLGWNRARLHPVGWWKVVVGVVLEEEGGRSCKAVVSGAVWAT